VRQVNEFAGLSLAVELLHLPHKAAGVEEEAGGLDLATELVHLPDKPAGVHPPGKLAPEEKNRDAPPSCRQ